MGSLYPELEKLTWDQVLRGKPDRYHPPYTVHLPINPAGSSDFVHVDAAMNVCRRRVFPGLSSRDWDRYVEAGTRETFILQFAFDDPPVVPDFRHTEISTVFGEYPLTEACYWAYDIYYQLQYVVTPIDSRQNALVVKCRATNEAVDQRTVTVRTKLNFQKESDLFPYHYTPFNWNASNWLQCKRTGLSGENLTLDSGTIGRLLDSDLYVKYQQEEDVDQSTYDLKFGGGCPQYVFPEFRLQSVGHLIKFTKDLQPQESAEFVLAVLVDYEDVRPEDIDFLANLTWDSALEGMRKHLASMQPLPATTLRFPAAEWDRIFEAVQKSTLGLLVDFPGADDLMPTQGGSSERHLVWVWEAVVMLLPMIKLGYFEHVKKSLKFIFGLQDSGYPPEGKFTSLAGAIGTTGPRWANTTGSALMLASDYYIHSGDKQFLEEYLPKMLRAADWVIGEIQATRVLREDGSRPLTYGVLPYACSTDGDTGHILAFSDAYSYWGLRKFADLLVKLHHDRAEQIDKETAQYRQDIQAAVKGVTREDGFINRLIPQPEDIVEPKFNNLVGAAHMAFTDCVDIESDSFQRFIEYFEQNMADDLFLGVMDREVAYTGVNDWVWQDIYLRLGSYKKAFAANRQNLLYGMTRNTYQVQERFSRFNPEFTPWQPNGSGNGKVLEMILKSIYFEQPGKVLLLAGVPFAYLSDNKITELSNLRTPGGLVSLRVEVQDCSSAKLQITSDGQLPALLEFPDFYKATSNSGLNEVSAGVFETAGGCAAEFVIEVTASPALFA